MSFFPGIGQCLLKCRLLFYACQTQFVGVGVCDTIGLVIANVDEELKKQMNIPEKFHAIGLIGSRTGAGAQIQAVDDAVKATSTEVISIFLSLSFPTNFPPQDSAISPSVNFFIFYLEYIKSVVRNTLVARQSG